MTGWGGAMRIAICEQNRAQRDQLSSWIWQVSGLYGIEPELATYGAARELLDDLRLRRFDIILLSADGPEGFLAVRQLRERDRQARIVFLTDTNRYMVVGVRLHLADYVVKPLEFQKISRSLKLCGIGMGGWG